MKWRRLLEKESIVSILLCWTVLSTTAVLLLTRTAAPGPRAVVAMGATLLVVWVLLFGGLMYALRDRVKGIVRRIPLPWWITFFLFFLALAMLEEAVTTGLTNMAPFFGAKVGEAYITASANYWDVILFHSVVVFVPAMVAWTWIFSRYDFSAFEAFLLWGIFGWLAEIGFSGPGQIPAFGFWIFVYGLMVWLPAYTLPQRQVAKPRFYHYILPFVLPILGLVVFFIIAAVLGKIFPGSYFAQLNGHPKIHFPPTG